ncbi:MAG: Asp-tRNA(Asn)/Glu-tRNA(Gln) amidotransferase subunit GatC [Planctomycetota bacterium]
MPHPISEQTIREVAKLARLNLTDEEAKLFSSQLGDVLGAIDQLKKLDVEDVKPMPHALDQLNVFRADHEKDGMPVENALANAPDKDGPFFKVPKVLGDGGGA